MCTLVLLHRVHPGLPLVVAANRDEVLFRQATAPRVVGERPRIVCGLDLKHGGTWLGASERGLFAGLTNQRTTDDARAPASRGEVVLGVLRCDGVEAAADYLASLAPGRYRPFNLVVGDGARLLVAYGRREAARIDVQDVAPGVHVLPNDVLDSPRFPKAARARAAAEALGPADGTWPDLARGLSVLLASHDVGPGTPVLPPGSRMPLFVARRLDALCVHWLGYGTRSAALLALEPGRVLHYLHAAGPPCRAPFEDVSALLAR